ncbi:MAG: cyclase family protein [Paracoccus sp. (in: a-proteobacteria)]|uniref:cyclase family protein n=1 Tax=Paracoccus sp. TaxID=267 RepID=UPI0026E0365F|nr:cyclase family protein [Paracoccus sp. (in: a-proteobacteria)]MDO5630429.1 cyclase family protein [Paracoccus sp. (in: a-proteobacteria)]
MCNACLIESVRHDAMSRRHLLMGAAAAGAAAVALGPVAARPALAASSGRVVDLTHAWDETFPTFDGKPGIAYEPDKVFDRDGYQLWKLTIWEHSGTHVDAPLHFSSDGLSVDQIPVAQLMCPLCIIDISAKAADDPNATVDAEDVAAFTRDHGDIPAGALVAMRSGWAGKLGDAAYRGTPDGTLAFPGFSKAATDLLAGMDVAGIGVDTLSLDPGNSADFAVHYSWLPGGRYGIENLAGLDDLPATGATIFVGAPKHKRGTGGPARVMAVI